jgi:hypothetical protein
METRGKPVSKPPRQPPSLILGLGLIEWVLVAERTHRLTLLESAKQVKEPEDSGETGVGVLRGRGSGFEAGVGDVGNMSPF